MNFANHIDHTLLEPTVRIASIEQLCKEAIDNNFRAVCVPPLFVKKAKGLLKDRNVKLATVVGFPFGYSAIEAKLAETVLAIVEGADEIDMMINIAALKNGDWQFLAREINTILPIIKNKGKKLKVIFETGLLTDLEIRTCCDIYGAAGVDAVKTSTGYFATAVTTNTVKMLRDYLAEAISINVCDEIDSYDAANDFINAGANTISTGKGIQIIKEGMTVD